MMTSVKGQKRRHAYQQNKAGQCRKSHRVDGKANFISMSEAREIAEHVFSGIAWSG